uniref:F-box protein 16 n=1 Tax=Phasianus colchicus TaxID=9054 RepID=A0A669Q766_PHACC
MLLSFWCLPAWAHLCSGIPRNSSSTSLRRSSRRASSHPRRSAEGTRSRHRPPRREEKAGRWEQHLPPPRGMRSPSARSSARRTPHGRPPLPGVPALCELRSGRKRDIPEGKPRPLRPVPNPAVTSARGPAAAAPLLPSGGGGRQRPRLRPARPRRSARPRPAPPPRPLSHSASPRRSSRTNQSEPGRLLGKDTPPSPLAGCDWLAASRAAVAIATGSGLAGGAGGAARGRGGGVGAYKTLVDSPSHLSMAFATSKNMNSPKLQIKMSTWTPLNNPLMNEQFIKWTDGQRQKILVDQLELCSLSLQKFCAKQLQDRIPIEALDFTMKLPRVLSLYIFSFLDPRSLCRCAQVSWHWKNLSELDQLWMKKCLRFGWYINFIPTPFEQGIWKRHYIEMVKELHVTRPKTASKDESVVTEVQKVRSNTPEAKPSAPEKKTRKKKKEIPPWRSPDKCPKDTMRFNCLNNYDPIEQARQACMGTWSSAPHLLLVCSRTGGIPHSRLVFSSHGSSSDSKRKKGGGETPDLSRQAAEKKKKAGCGSKKLQKSTSLLSLTEDLGSTQKRPSRPSWATSQPIGNLPYREAAKNLAQSSQFNAGIRPAPVRAPVPKPRAREKKDFTEMTTMSPCSPQCEAQPGLIPPSNNDLVQAKEGSEASVSMEQKLTCLDGGDNISVA